LTIGFKFVEGEKDVDHLMGLGLVATTSPMGAGKWRDHYSESLRGKAVVLIPDNDQPGRDHMNKVAEGLVGIAASIRWLDLPDLPPGGDATVIYIDFENPLAVLNSRTQKLGEGEGVFFWLANDENKKAPKKADKGRGIDHDPVNRHL
jgi:hypothetical protein